MGSRQKSEPIAVQAEVVTVEEWQRRVVVPVFIKKVYRDSGDVEVKVGDRSQLVREGDVLKVTWDLE